MVLNMLLQTAFIIENRPASITAHFSIRQMDSLMYRQTALPVESYATDFASQLLFPFVTRQVIFKIGFGMEFHFAVLAVEHFTYFYLLHIQGMYLRVMKYSAAVVPEVHVANLTTVPFELPVYLSFVMIPCALSVECLVTTLASVIPIDMS